MGKVSILHRFCMPLGKSQQSANSNVTLHGSVHVSAYFNTQHSMDPNPIVTKGGGRFIFLTLWIRFLTQEWLFNLSTRVSFFLWSPFFFFPHLIFTLNNRSKQCAYKTWIKMEQVLLLRLAWVSQKLSIISVCFVFWETTITVSHWLSILWISKQTMKLNNAILEKVS